MINNLYNIILSIFVGIAYIYYNNEYPTIIVKYPIIDENKNKNILIIDEKLE